ncbi:GDP-man:man(3)glcnac(2)-pp-dol alpha-1,2-mannosyltransferase [Plakobranchus ocellatus]|uniref:GDP-Man:Man(3)GlcNAc(2)-PP-Dol alpha-1,2-mannosyltransferase n=1 Tax=Plakobranchus ocellatus TaxID=259542 RepID=A0AAV3YHQ2_9GAST|nr:GDP-man:man(3)glcnac(2)-pp-dol alpha-1,2-mannosyltransferase [Plakobranchus ocellatus]
MNYGCDSNEQCLKLRYPAFFSLQKLSSPSQTTAMVILCLVLTLQTVVFLAILHVVAKFKSKVFKDAEGKRKPTFAFFHPYCNAGGGGERVLWVAVRSIQKKYPNIQCVIFSGDTDATPDEILNKARQRFNIRLPGHVEFIFLKRRGWVEAVKYPYFTLLGQSLGSILLGMEALLTHVPDVYMDTMGYAFTLPLFRYIGGCKVACYVHYPTISTDMLNKVSERVAAHNNASFISRSPVLSGIKILYYRMFAFIYGLAGKCASIIMVNSTWTYNHITCLWMAADRTHIVYPPCDIAEFLVEPLDSNGERLKQILSLGQFRPEKDHPLQLKAFHKFLSTCGDKEKSEYQLVLAGSCRHEEDQARVKKLQDLAKELGIHEQVKFQLNVPFAELKKLLFESMISLHTMWNEHFGICVVEGMAAGTVMLAHDSGGPKLDIVVQHNNKRTGFLASDEDSYAAAMKTIFQLSAAERLDIRENARESISRFSEDEFESVFLMLCEPLLKTSSSQDDLKTKRDL